MLPKLCYILPEYRSDDTTHFAHIHDFLKEIGKRFELYLLVEKGTKPDPSLGYASAHLLFFSFLPFRFFELLFRLAVARASGYRDFYVHYSFAAAFAAAIVVRLSGDRVFYWNCGEPWKYKRGFLREFFERMTYRIITFQVTGASSLADQYAFHYRIPRSKIKILPNWIDLRRFVPEERAVARQKLGIPDDKKVVLFVHRLSPRKGSRMIVPVAREVLRTHSETLFVIVGNGPDEEMLRKEAFAGMRIEGKIPNNKIATYFSAADVLFMPSEEEGFPRVLLEAMAMGLPFVASDVGAVRGITPPILQASLVSSGNVSHFSKNLEKILGGTREERERTHEALIREAKKYDIATVAERFKHLF